MEFIPSAPQNVPLTVFALVCFFALLGGVPVLAGTMPDEPGVRRRVHQVVLGVVAGVSSLTLASLYFFYSDPAAVARSQAVTASLDSYGLDMSKDERAALEYPSARPEGDFEVFGSFTREGPTAEGFSRETVYLIWKDDLLHLASSPDGEQFTALEPRG